MTTSTRTDVTEWLEERQQRFITISDTIWKTPEVALAETKACNLQAEDLERDGFRITRNVGELPTAFMAEWGSGSPIIGFLGEYDALPGLSQKNQAKQDPIVSDGPGHGCGHNLLGTASLAAAVSIKAWLEHTGRPGTVRYYGCPAEETCEGKVFMARAGVFDDLDAAITWHPGSVNSVWAGSSLAVNNIKFRFHGRTAHAAAQPETGRSSLDAVELMNVGVNYLREHVIDAARIHYVITHGGGAPNVVPDDAEVWYFIRAPRRDQVEELTERVRKIAAGAAMMTETTLEENFQAGAYNMLSNQVIGDRMQEILEEMGPIPFEEEEMAFGKMIADAFPERLRAGLLAAEKLPPELVSQGLCGDVFPIRDRGETMPGSTDVSDVSWITPTAQFTTTCHPVGVPGHSWGITATGAMSIGHKGMVHAAKGMAMTAVDLYENPKLLKAAQDEFKASTAGQPYKSPLPEGTKPRTAR